MESTRDEAAVAQLKLRIREPLRAAIERDADRRGVSMNTAICERIERSLRDEEAFGGGPRTQALLRSMGNQTRLWKGEPDSWLDDPAGYNQISSAWKITIDGARPPISSLMAQRFEEGRQAALRLARNDYPTAEQRDHDRTLCNFLAIDPSMPEGLRIEFRRFVIEHGGEQL
jgi:hypothetical protein